MSLVKAHRAQGSRLGSWGGKQCAPGQPLALGGPPDCPFPIAALLSGWEWGTQARQLISAFVSTEDWERACDLKWPS